MKKTTLIWVSLLSLMSACDMVEKTDRPSNANIQELNASHDLEGHHEQSMENWGECDESRVINELFSTINKAESGDTIIIQPGTYWGAGEIVDKHNLTLDFSNVRLLTKQDETLFKIQQCSNIHIHGLTIYHDPKLAGCFTNCFDVDYSQNITFSNCDINGSGFIGICINQCSGVKVEECKIHECQYGVFVWGNNSDYNIKQFASSDVVILNCIFEQNSAGNVCFDSNYARATHFRIKVDALDFLINSGNMMRFLTDNNHYEVAPNTSGQIVSDKITILSASRFGKGELDPNIENMTWVGLFRNDLDSSIHCYNTKLNTKPIYDPMSDDEGETSGIQISYEGHDKNPILLISGLQMPNDVKIESYNILKNSLMPGESMKVGSCTIKASGDIDEHGYITDYQLTITGEKKGVKIEQTFLEQGGFDDAMINFLWAGDIDQDGLPDLYMDISHKYSFSNPALYLSSKADPEKLIKLVADTQVFGC